jgi:hypothetical protein
MIAAQSGNVDMLRCLGKELGADVNKGGPNGDTALLHATIFASLNIVRCLVKDLGADVNQANVHMLTTLMSAACEGDLGVVRWLLAEGGASVDGHHPNDETFWDILEVENADDVELASLIKTIVLLADAPSRIIAKLSQQHAELWAQGLQLRMQLPAYLVQQRASIVAHFPLPGVLQPLVAEYAAPTSEDMWTDGLGVSVVERSVGCFGGMIMRCTVC